MWLEIDASVNCELACCVNVPCAATLNNNKTPAFVGRDEAGYDEVRSDDYADDSAAVSLASIVSDGLRYPASSYSADLASSHDHSPHSDSFTYLQHVRSQHFSLFCSVL